MTDRVTQRNIRGKYVAGHNINIEVDPNLIRQLEALAEKLESEMDKDVFSNQISDDLLDYGYAAHALDSNALENKLSLAELEDRIERAKHFKDRFRRSLEKHIHYRSAQRIYTIIMSAILHKFDVNIIPAIKSGVSGDELYAMVADLVIDPLVLSMPESALDADHSRVWGVLFFLTGNCFIWWSKR
ncbi:MAG: hypothetical protein RIA71_08235 [Oceanicaulis sp.]